MMDGESERQALNVSPRPRKLIEHTRLSSNLWIRDLLLPIPKPYSLDFLGRENTWYRCRGPFPHLEYQTRIFLRVRFANVGML